MRSTTVSAFRKPGTAAGEFSDPLVASKHPHKVNFTAAATIGLARLHARIQRARRHHHAAGAATHAAQRVEAASAHPNEHWTNPDGTLAVQEAAAMHAYGVHNPLHTRARPMSGGSTSSSSSNPTPRHGMGVHNSPRAHRRVCVGPDGVTAPHLVSRFQLLGLIGQGNFCQMFRARDLYRDRDVAIKVMNAKYTDAGCQEYLHLLHIQPPVSAAIPVVRLITRFTFHGHLCLVLELLGQTLEERYMKRERRRHSTQHQHQQHPACPPAQLRKIAFQLLSVLAYTRSKSIIHADIKPANVLFVTSTHGSAHGTEVQQGDERRATFHPESGSRSSSCSLRLADWGNSITLDMVSMYTDDYEIQPLAYRAPEVLLGAGTFDAAVDVWSVGCILAELYLGAPLFASHTRSGVLHRIVQVLGLLPARFGCGKFADAHRHFLVASPTAGSTVSGRDDAAPTAPPPAKPFSPQRVLDRLRETLGCRDLHFTGLLQSLLALDPQRRATPVQALAHPYFMPLLPLSLLLSAPSPLLCHNPQASTTTPTRAAASASASAFTSAPSARPHAAAVPVHGAHRHEGHGSARGAAVLTSPLNAVLAAAQRAVALAQRRRGMKRNRRAPAADACATPPVVAATPFTPTPAVPPPVIAAARPAASPPSLPAAKPTAKANNGGSNNNTTSTTSGATRTATTSSAHAGGSSHINACMAGTAAIPNRSGSSGTSVNACTRTGQREVSDSRAHAVVVASSTARASTAGRALVDSKQAASPRAAVKSEVPPHQPPASSSGAHPPLPLAVSGPTTTTTTTTTPASGLPVVVDVAAVVAQARAAVQASRNRHQRHAAGRKRPRDVDNALSTARNATTAVVKRDHNSRTVAAATSRTAAAAPVASAASAGTGAAAPAAASQGGTASAHMEGKDEVGDARRRGSGAGRGSNDNGSDRLGGVSDATPVLKSHSASTKPPRSKKPRKMTAVGAAATGPGVVPPAQHAKKRRKEGPTQRKHGSGGGARSSTSRPFIEMLSSLHSNKLASRRPQQGQR